MYPFKFVCFIAFVMVNIKRFYVVRCSCRSKIYVA